MEINIVIRSLEFAHPQMSAKHFIAFCHVFLRSFSSNNITYIRVKTACYKLMINLNREFEKGHAKYP